MSEMVERVAWVVTSAGHCDWTPETCRAGECQCKALARATITAMREPCRDMLDAAYISTKITGDAPKGLLSRRNKQRVRWRAMIDAALK